MIKTTEIQKENPELINETPSEDLPDEQLSLEKLRAENEELRAAMRLREAREDMVAELNAAGARSPALLFDSIKENFQFGDDGKPVNAKALLSRLKNSYPEQFGTGPHVETIDGGAGSGRAASPLTKEALARMTPAQIAELDWNEVRTVLASR